MLYARLLDDDGTPMEVTTFPAVYNLLEQPWPWPIDTTVRVIGHVPPEFASMHGMERIYKVTITTSDKRAQCNALKSTLLTPDTILVCNMHAHQVNRGTGRMSVLKNV